jgi:hypothetical protein
MVAPASVARVPGCCAEQVWSGGQPVLEARDWECSASRPNEGVQIYFGLAETASHSLHGPTAAPGVSGVNAPAELVGFSNRRLRF